MTSSEAATTLIHSHFATAWALTAYASTPVLYGRNMPATYATGTVPWLWLTHREYQSEQTSLGNTAANAPNFRYTGLITVQVFVLQQTGTQLAEQMADAAAGIYLQFQTSSAGAGRITNQPGTTPNVEHIGIDQAGWMQLNVTVDYIRDKHELS